MNLWAFKTTHDIVIFPQFHCALVAAAVFAAAFSFDHITSLEYAEVDT